MKTTDRRGWDAPTAPRFAVPRPASALVSERFRRAVKAYKKLVALIEARAADGATRLWRSHMDSAGTYLLKDDLRDKPVVELFT